MGRAPMPDKETLDLVKANTQGAVAGLTEPFRDAFAAVFGGAVSEFSVRTGWRRLRSARTESGRAEGNHVLPSQQGWPRRLTPPLLTGALGRA